MKNTIKLPQSQQDIIVKALQAYQVVNKFIEEGGKGTALRMLTGRTDGQHYTDFDITTLTKMFEDKDVDVRIELDQEIHDSFAHRHGVDFPEYV